MKEVDKLYYLGIDGGGTKTAFALMNEEGDIVSSFETSGCYFPDLGTEGLYKLLLSGIENCAKGIDFSEIVACAGIPLYGESESLMLALKEMEERLPVKISFVNDVEVGFYGALGFQAGINIVAGTGSIAIGFDESGNFARSGGFGHDFGCDEGSAYYIASKLINQFTHQVDFRANRTLLYGAFKRQIFLKDDLHVMTYFLEEVKMERDKIAQLSRFAYELARHDDEACIQIFKDAAYEIHMLGLGVARQLSFVEKPIKVSYTGGVFKAGDFVLKPLRELLKKHDMELVEPLHAPVYGACLKARKG